MANNSEQKISGRIIKVWFSHHFAFYEPAVELGTNDQDDHGKIYRYTQIDKNDINKYISERLHEIEIAWQQIIAVNKTLSTVRVERGGTFTQYERITRRRNQQLRNQLNDEWIDTHNQLKIIGNQPEQD